MNIKLCEQFEIVEFSRGINGILDDLRDFCLDCANSAKNRNDNISAKEYKLYAVKIGKIIK